MLCGSNCASLQFYFESLFFFKAVSWGIYQSIIKWSSTVAPISKIWERERERLWVERWGKEIELEEVYGYGCLGKEIYCIPYQFHPFHSFPLVLLFPLFSPICVSVCLVNQQYFFFPSISIDFISEISFHFPLPCVVIHESFYDSQFFMITFVDGCHRRSFKEDYIGSLETTKTPIKSKACLKSAFRVFINDLFWKKKNWYHFNKKWKIFLSKSIQLLILL